MNTLFGLGIVLFLLMPLSARSQQLDFGMTPTDFLRAINTVSLKVKVRIIGQTSTMIEYGIGQCVVADGEIDNDRRLDSVRTAPAPNDQSACPANDDEMRTLVAASTAEVMEVLTDVPDIEKNLETLATLAQPETGPGIRSPLIGNENRPTHRAYAGHARRSQVRIRHLSVGPGSTEGRVKCWHGLSSPYAAALV